ncbi:hypothetical protein [Nocardia camponoti]|uniref:hypothetical protein n=1 Tax=Nocardia camponoti TaxID=1616106 RepID=UPI001662B3DB|nr:hypothetical protein [Nocardia camponoti]
MSRRRPGNLTACRPRQGARRLGAGWTVDDRWAGIATVPRSVAGEGLFDFGPADAETERTLARPGDDTDAESSRDATE